MKKELGIGILLIVVCIVETQEDDLLFRLHAMAPLRVPRLYDLGSGTPKDLLDVSPAKTVGSSTQTGEKHGFALEKLTPIVGTYVAIQIGVDIVLDIQQRPFMESVWPSH